MEVFLNIIYYLLTSEIEEITVIKQLMGSAYSIVLSAQENNDNLAQILEIHFSFINLILKELIPKYKNQKQILFHSIKVIGLLLTGYDSTVEVLKVQYIFLIIFSGINK